MHNLIYLSAASHLFSEDELIELLNKSRLNNTRLGITGLLLYNEGSILQIMEGEKKTIHALFDIIKRDNRHKGIIKMIDFDTRERSFSDWSMGFKQISDKDWSTLGGYLNLDNKQEFRRLTSLGSSDIITLVKSFAHVNMMNI